MNKILKEDLLNDVANDPDVTRMEIEERTQTVSASWARDWVKSHKDYSWSKPRVIEAERSKACVQKVVEEWFQTLKEKCGIESVLPSLIANFDETMVQPSISNKVKVVKRNDSNVVAISEAD